MRSLFLFLSFLFFISSISNTQGQEKVLRPDAPTAINVHYNESDYIIPESQAASDEFNGVKFRNIEGIEASFINQSWQGLITNSTYRPPDSHGAAGPSGIIATVNLRIAYYTKAGVQNWIDDMGGAGNFFPSSTGGNLSDPRTLYDHVSGRFYVMVQENSTTNAYLNLAVSKDNNPSTSTTTEWWFYRYEITETIGASKYGADYPGFGFDGQAIYTTFNMYPLPLSGSPKNCQIVIANKSQAIAGTLGGYTKIFTPGYTIYSAFTLQPATVMSATGPTNKAYFGEVCLGASDSIRIWALSDPLGTPSLSSYKFQVSSNGGYISGGAPQLGTATTVPTLSNRTQGNAIWYNGALWFCHTAGGSSGRAKVYYYKVNTNDFADANPTLAEMGAIDGGTGIWTYQPSIGANIFGDVCLVYSESSSSKYPEIKFTTRKSTTSTWDTPQLLKASLSYSNSDRWGDYASVTQDPVDNTFWVVHEWSRSNTSHDWGTWWGNIIPPTTINITVIPQGFYNSVSNQLNMSDIFTVDLRNTTSPYTLIESATATVSYLTLQGYFYFANAPSGTYYLVVKHRNSLETWSKSTGIAFTRGGTVSYDFSSAQNQAYGNNLKLKGSKWCVINGDCNQDDYIDGSDYLEVLNYWETSGTTMAGDTNGDQYIDGSDYLQILNNWEIGSITPP